jgi:hypothetical protein
VHGEVIGLGRSGNTAFYPVLAAVHHVIHLWHHHAGRAHLDGTTIKGNPSLPPTSLVSSALRLMLSWAPPTVSFPATSWPARCAAQQVDSDLTCLLDHWRSYEVLLYPHAQAEPVMLDFSSRMLSGGNFTLHPNHEVPLL